MVKDDQSSPSALTLKWLAAKGLIATLAITYDTQFHEHEFTNTLTGLPAVFKIHAIQDDKKDGHTYIYRDHGDRPYRFRVSDAQAQGLIPGDCFQATVKGAYIRAFLNIFENQRSTKIEEVPCPD